MESLVVGRVKIADFAAVRLRARMGHAFPSKQAEAETRKARFYCRGATS